MKSRREGHCSLRTVLWTVTTTWWMISTTISKEEIWIRGWPVVNIVVEGFSWMGRTTTIHRRIRNNVPVHDLPSSWSRRIVLRQQSSRRFQAGFCDNYYEDDDEEDDDERYVESRKKTTNRDGKYWEEEEEDDENNSYDDDDEEEERNKNPSSSNKHRGGIYKVKFDSARDMDPKETQLDWEVSSEGETEALVLLPPEAVQRPSAILHFVGGTFFGSLPKIYYGSLLEGLVRNTQCAVVVTPIPVTLLKSPLQHLSLGKKLQKSFDMAWKTVLEDEYGDLRDVPLCGIGHSLGARLLVVLTTLSENQVRYPTIPPYKSFILLSFTNYGAAAGIPGISTLLKESKKQERITQVKQERGRRRQARRRSRSDWWLQDEEEDGQGDREDRNDDDEEDWDQLLGDLQNLVQQQTSRVREVLTPNSKDLEFLPSPDQLWKAVQDDGRYKVPKTLLVQFDDDTIDQSSKLAQTLHDTRSSCVHFARIRGEHLTPVSVMERRQGEDDNGEGSWLSISTRTSRAIWKSIQGRTKSSRQESSMRELRQTLCSYILDVVTKP